MFGMPVINKRQQIAPDFQPAGAFSLTPATSSAEAANSANLANPVASNLVKATAAPAVKPEPSAPAKTLSAGFDSLTPERLAQLDTAYRAMYQTDAT
jgi:hypothetical protein